MQPEITIYDKRLVISYDTGKTCLFRCSFCYHHANLGVSQSKSPQEIRLILDSINKGIYEIITPGCEQELFVDKDKAMEFIRTVARANKIVSFCTRTNLSRDTVRELSKIDRDLKKSGNYLVVEYSFVSGLERPDLEVKCPSVESRLESIARLNEEGIFISPFIRPILPDEIVPLDEICTLVDKTKAACQLYTLGDFYFNSAIAKKLGLDKLGKTFWSKVREDAKTAFFTKNLSWKKFIDENKKKRIVQHISQAGREASDSSTETILKFRKYLPQEKV